MKKIIILMAALILFGFIPAISAVTFGGNLGFNIQDIKDPGASFVTGAQEKLGENNFLRIGYQYINYGRDNLNCLSVMDVYYWVNTDNYAIGSRVNGDLQTEGGNVGLAIGFEYLKKNIVKDISAFINFDAVTKKDVGNYITIGLGLIADIGKK